ncbi:MAG TPA: RagB/SusD family nutrient uptake outer membrane protein [Catalimonadaceae bacterium]|nr:RagB/SusD family nutrient uptake outer membrane protein [Catalimonadaceae bacterium]
MFEKGKNEFMPIPQQQINLSKGLYKQNPGY